MSVLGSNNIHCLCADGRVASRVDAVIVSHPTIAHLGALPYLVGRHGLRAPLYGTMPVRKLGETTMLEHLSLKQASTRATFAYMHWQDPSMRPCMVPQRPVLTAACMGSGDADLRSHARPASMRSHSARAVGRCWIPRGGPEHVA